MYVCVLFFRMFVGNTPCSLVDKESGSMYGIALTFGNNGYIKCKNVGDFVGKIFNHINFLETPEKCIVNHCVY